MTFPREDHPAAKAALRARLRAARRELGPDERAAVEAGLVRAALAGLPAGARAVALYDARPTEPGTRALRAALAERGLVVVLPVVVGPEEPLAWVVDGDADDDGGGGGRAWPSGLGGVDVVLLPALAVDRSGTRLGQGGGHYDRSLAPLLTALPPGSAPRPPSRTALPPGSARPLLVAVVRDVELLAAGSLPREAHDVVVDAALTPSGWRDLA